MKKFVFTMEQSTPKCQKLALIRENASKALFDKLPDEMVEMCIKMAMRKMTTQERYEFLVDVIPKVSRRFKDIGSHQSMWRGFSPFEKLPNDVAEIIIKMVMKNMPDWKKHNFLVDVVAKISTRFKAFAALKSLWKGHVEIWRLDGVQVIQELLCGDTTSLNLISSQHISAYDIKTMAERCPKMEMLFLHYNFGMLPNLIVPWTSLKRLFLVGGLNSVELFRNVVEFHHNFPNLE